MNMPVILLYALVCNSADWVKPIIDMMTCTQWCIMMSHNTAEWAYNLLLQHNISLIRPCIAQNPSNLHKI